MTDSSRAFAFFSLDIVVAGMATIVGSWLICSILYGIVEGTDLLFAVALELLLGGAGYLCLVWIVIPAVCFAIAADMGKNIENALPDPSDAFFEEQDRCFCQCRHTIAWEDNILCVKKKKTLTELTADEIRSCDTFEPYDEETEVD